MFLHQSPGNFLVVFPNPQLNSNWQKDSAPLQQQQ